MRYQLVLQFEGDDDKTLDKVIDLEDQLIETLGGSAEVDGHDTGEGTSHIAILTANPRKLWERIEPMLEDAAGEDLELVAVAYRPSDADDYTVLWPEDYDGEFAIS